LRELSESFWDGGGVVMFEGGEKWQKQPKSPLFN
jgi:hypothetical protein